MSTGAAFKSKEAEDYATVSKIAKRFENPHTDLTAVEGRSFIMEGTLVRQASSRWKHVTRECFLFNDIFVFAVKIDKKQEARALTMKQVIDLSTAVLDDRTKGKTGMKNCVCITSPDREYVVSAKTPEERERWVTAIAGCIGTLKGGKLTSKGSLVTQHSIHLGTIFSSVVLNNLVDMKKNIKQKKFDVNAKDASGNTALHLAIENGHMDAIELLLDVVQDDTSFLLSASNESGFPALHLAAVEGNVSLVKRLLEVKADVKQLDENKNTCAYVAVTRGVNVADVVTALVSAGADFRTPFGDGKTLMHLAAELNDGLTITVLADAGLILTSECNHGRAPLHYAAQTNSQSACEALLGAGTGPNVRDQNLNTPLHLSRSVQMGVMLVCHGSRLDLKNVHDLPASAFFDSDQKNLAVVQQARETWLHSKSCDRDEEVCTDKDQWVNDKLSDVCQLCYDTFTMTKRRHHCRRCGSLVCGYCSSKKFKIVKESGTEKERCCDSCYNILRYKIVKRRLVEQKIRDAAAAAAGQDNAARKAEKQAKRDEETKERRARIKAEEEKTKAVSNRIKDKDKSTVKRNKEAAGKTADVMNQNKQLLKNNIEKLDQMGDNAAKMEDEAANFAGNAKALKEKFK